MRVVPKAVTKPHHCAVIPYLGSQHEGFIDTGTELPGFDNHVYVSLTALEEMNKLVGNPTPEQLEEALKRLEDAHQRIEGLEAQIADAENFIGAIEAFESKDFRARKKKGPKPKKETSKA